MKRQFAPAGRARVIAAAIVGVEGAILGLAAVLYAVLAVVDDADSRGLSLGLAALSGGAAIGLLFLARALWNARCWATAPALTWQVLQGFAVAVSPGHPVVTIVGLALAVTGAIAIGLAARGEASAG